MTTRLKRVPDWFDVRKYTSASELDTAGWWIQFHKRQEIYRAQAKKNTHNQYLIDEFVRAILDNPIFETDPSHFFMMRHIHGRPLNYISLRSASPSDIFDHASDLDEHAPMARAAHRMDLIAALLDEEVQAIRENPFDLLMKSRGIESLRWCTLMANLNATDEQLERDFKSWLAEARELLAVPSPRREFSPVEFNRWINAAVLPYFDLTFWASANDFKFTQATLANAIFPDEFDVDLTEKLRKTTIPMTNEIICDSRIINGLKLQAQAELT